MPTKDRGSDRQTVYQGSRVRTLTAGSFTAPIAVILTCYRLDLSLSLAYFKREDKAPSNTLPPLPFQAFQSRNLTTTVRNSINRPEA